MRAYFFAVLLLGALPMTAVRAAEGGVAYQLEMSRLVPMRDGVPLEVWITRPAHAGAPLPAILSLTQYDIDGGRRGEPPYFAQHGYVWVQAYVRGRGLSGGLKSDNLGLTVGRDGYDLVEWIAKQPWSDGRVVMYGGSFVGMTQWHTAAQLPPHLAAIAPYVPIYPGWDVPNTNGIPQAWTAVILGYTAGRTLNTGFFGDPGYWQGKMLEQYAAQRPFAEMSAVMGIADEDWWMPDEHGTHLPMMRMWLDHVGDEAFNLAGEPKPAQYAAMQLPVLTATGFYDDDQPGTLRYYRMHAASSPAANRTYLVIGPWDHGGTQTPSKVIDGLEIPANAVVDMKKLHLEWYDWALGRGPLPEFFHGHRMAFYVMGENTWHYAETLQDSMSGKELVLSLSDRAGTPLGVYASGRLSEATPGAEPPAQLVSDPRELPELELAQYLPDENLLSTFRDYQKRALLFHTEPFTKDVVFAGHMRLTLVCSADAPDFDLAAQVTLVRADGSTVRLGQDIRRARFRDGPFNPQLLKSGQLVEIPFQFNWAAWRIPAGARLRLSITPLNSAAYQKNYNTGGRIGYERPEDARVAHVAIYHDAQHRSRLVLPLLTEASVAEHPN